MPAAHVIDFKDARKESRQAKNPIAFDIEAAEVAMAVTGVQVGAETKIIVRVKDGDTKAQGSARQVGPDTFVVTVRMAPKAHYEDRHAYIVNNSFFHEFRHVAQMQENPNFAVEYAVAEATVGYAKNPWEMDARAHGRLADHTGTKNTMGAGPAVGKVGWAIVPKGVSPE